MKLASRLVAVLLAALTARMDAATAPGLAAEARAERPKLAKDFPEAFAIFLFEDLGGIVEIQ